MTTADVSGPDRTPKSASLAALLVTLARNDPSPVAILLPADPHGHETAARVAVRLDTGLITAAVAVRPGPAGPGPAGTGPAGTGPAGPIAVQRCLGASYEVESSVTRGVPVITVTPEAGAPELAPVTPLLEEVKLLGRTGPGIEVLESVPSHRTAHPALDQADIVVAGGRGLGSAAAFRLVEDLAAALGGAPAGSHTAAELGWCPRDRRVGLTGRTVRPRLYLASGISGSVRHRAGMQGAKTVVAIDTDASAPLLKLADLGVVGDATRVLPALLAEIERRRTGPVP
jgi:electron transfer flavoprotein alpha subunit